MNNEKSHIIANPAAGGGRTGRMLGTVREILHTSFGSDTTIFITAKAGDALDSARRAVLDGSRRIVIVGGDGTIHECVNGIFSLPAAYTREVSLAIISTGTGCGLARSLGIPAEIEQQVEIARTSGSRAIDLGKIRFTEAPGARFFVNECQIGIGAEVVRRTRNGKKAVGGHLAYAIATLPLLFTYPNPEITLELDDESPLSLAVTGISIGIGAITGGGMHLTPRALLDDGLIDVLVMEGQSPISRAAGFAKVRTGEHILAPHFGYHQVRRVRISSDADLLVAADGEVLGNLPATFEVLHHAVHVHCPVQTGREDHHEHVCGQTEEVGI